MQAHLKGNVILWNCRLLESCRIEFAIDVRQLLFAQDFATCPYGDPGWPWRVLIPEEMFAVTRCNELTEFLQPIRACQNPSPKTYAFEKNPLAASGQHSLPTPPPNGVNGRMSGQLLGRFGNRDE
jgi:hypothetical protein